MRSSRNGSGRRATGSSVAGKSAREWVVRGTFAALALALAVPAIASALGNVLVKVDPERAYALARDGRTAAALAQRRFAAAPDSNAGSDQARLAMQALQKDPTTVDALNVLAMQAQLRSDDALSDRYFSYSFALSRRELQPQIWTIEKAVEQGDIRRALINYDLALRTSRRAQQTFFPVLASALSEPIIRREVLTLLEDRPVWGPAFLSFAARQGRDALTISRFLEDVSARGLEVTNAQRAQVVNGLVAQNLIDEAWSFYQSFRSGVSVNRSRDPDFDMGVDGPSVFDWSVGRTAGLSAAIVQGESGGFVDFAVPGGTRAVVVSQTQILPPGRYRLEGVSSAINQPERSLPYWSLTCRAGGELGRVNVPNSAENEGRFAGEITVPQGCPVQTLSLTLRASDRASGVSGQIERVQLAPIGERGR